MKHSIVPWEAASKQPKCGINSPPAKTWILSRPPLMSSAILPNRWAAPWSTSSAGVQVVDMRHWNLGWAMTLGASTTAAAAPAATRVAPFMMNRLRPSIRHLRGVDSIPRVGCGSPVRARQE